MLKEGDIVKVVSATEFQGKLTELIPIGTICRVVETSVNEPIAAIVPISRGRNSLLGAYWYLENELEKGHMEWVVEEKPKIKKDGLKDFSAALEEALSSDTLDEVLRYGEHLVAEAFDDYLVGVYRYKGSVYYVRQKNDKLITFDRIL